MKRHLKQKSDVPVCLPDRAGENSSAKCQKITEILKMHVRAGACDMTTSVRCVLKLVNDVSTYETSFKTKIGCSRMSAGPRG